MIFFKKSTPFDFVTALLLRITAKIFPKNGRILRVFVPFKSG